MVILIAAQAKNRVIGKDNKLLWSLPADMKHFRDTTKGGVVIMGRKTYESIGRPLPNRVNIVISSNKKLIIDGCIVVNSIKKALRKAGSDSNIFIIGGGEIYKQSMCHADKIILTEIGAEFEGDTYFPEIDKSWIKVSRKDFEPDDKNPYTYSFIEYEKYSF